uniref:Uncharacterized protein n=1 Tax=Caenorhabditis japonica TaxID=281687 RepID=A0A8R1EF60_CAEJA
TSEVCEILFHWLKTAEASPKLLNKGFGGGKQMDEMTPETMDGRGARGTEDLELTVEDGHVGVKRRRKLWKKFARFVNAADKVEEQVMEKLISVQRCTVRQREMIVGPIVEFRKELSARFEEVGRDKWPRAVLRLMREQKLETVEELRELCER